MAKARLSMRKIREVLRLKFDCALSGHQIAQLLDSRSQKKKRAPIRHWGHLSIDYCSNAQPSFCSILCN